MEPYLSQQPMKKAMNLVQTPRVLVIDDDETMIHLISALLEEINCEVKTASNGLVAMKLLDEHGFDLVITDIIMPGMEGLELVRKVSRSHPDVKIIAMSGYRASGHLDYLKHAQEFGADQTFEKPFDVELFLNSVKDLVTPKD